VKNKSATLSLGDSSTFYVAANLIGIAAVLSYFITFDVAVPAPGAIASGGAIPIVAEVSGRVQKVYVSEGANVYIGDPLVQLDTHELLFKKRALESRIHLAEQHLKGSRPDLPRLYRELHEIQLDLERHTITSPVNGRIVWPSWPDAGGMVSAGAAIAVAVPRKPTPDLSIKRKSAGSICFQRYCLSLTNYC
jgi:multidrug resistance efflux pump